MKKFLVATMALAMLALSATAALADHETVGTGTNAGACATFAHGLNLQQSASALGDTSIRVSWNDWCSNEDRYHVLRSGASDGTFTSVATVSKLNGATGAAMSHADTGLAACTTYYYKVKAVKDANSQGNGGGESESLVFSAKTTGCVEGKDAPAIANKHLKDNAAAAAACDAKYDGAANAHGKVISEVAHEFEGRSFTPAEEYIVTDWVDGFCAS